MGNNERSATGAKTLARGIAALQAVVDAPDGLSAQEVAETLGVHRTIAHRMLVTLAEARLIAKGSDAKYRGAVGLMKLQSARYTALKHLLEPYLADLAERIGAAVTLLVEEGDQAVALMAHSPKDTRFQLAFSEGDRHSINLAAGGLALRSLMPKYAGEAGVAQVKADGYAVTYGEVEPGAWGLAVPLDVPDGPIACLNMITHREDVVRASKDLMLQAGAQIGELLESC